MKRLNLVFGLILGLVLIGTNSWGAWPSDSVRTKNWGNEVLTDTDLEAQYDIIHTYIVDMMNATTGHKHDATANEGPLLELNDSNSVIAVTGTLGATNGGTGLATITDGGIMLGSGTGNVTPMAVLADGEIVVGDGTTDPVALAAFTSSTGDLKHESGGLEFDASAVTKGDLIASTGAGTMVLLNVGSNGQALVADSTASEGFKWDTTFKLNSVTNETTVTTSSNITIAASKLYLVYFEVELGGTVTRMDMKFNSGVGGNYDYVSACWDMGTPTQSTDASTSGSAFILNTTSAAANTHISGHLYIDTFKRNSDSGKVHGSLVGGNVMCDFAGFLDGDITVTDFEFIFSSAADTLNVYLYELDLAT